MVSVSRDSELPIESEHSRMRTKAALSHVRAHHLFKAWVRQTQPICKWTRP